MSMLTRCPHCDTVFRVTPHQLQKQHGQVRCGRCMHVFDGFRTLSSEVERPSANGGVELPSGVAPSAPAAAAAHEPALKVEPASRPTPAAPAQIPAESPATATEATLEPGADASAGELPTVHAAHSRHTAYWAIASVLLACVLLVQLAYVYRVELAAQYPAFKPLLVKACVAAGCTVPLPQHPKSISIEASDLQVPDAARPGVIQLTATLRSHAAYDVAYPALDLVLTNAQEHTLARRIFSPEEYLDKSKDPRAGIPPNAEVTLQLDLDTGNLGAVGFRLDLLPAPL